MSKDVHSLRYWRKRFGGHDPSREPMGNVDREDTDLTPELSNLRNQLRAMPRVRPTEQQALQLRILASKERVRSLHYADWSSTWRHLRQRLSLHLDNIMKPIAVPAAGGLMVALSLFLLLSSVYPLRTVNAASFDVPTRLSTTASVKTMASFTSVERPVTLLVMVNNEGRAVSYSIEKGQEALQDEDVRRRIEQMLLFTVFTPATNFGLPRAGQVLISVDSNVILVRG